MKTIGILYICTGKYTTFWPDFYKSCENFLLRNQCELHYYVFTDDLALENSENSRVHLFFQESMAWPYPTLYRFRIFQKARSFLEEMDYIYFFNANMLFLEGVSEEILPDESNDLVFVQHPLMSRKKVSEFTYERNPESLAYIPEGGGITYFMGGLNGGVSSAYLAMIDELDKRILIDEEKGIIAIWHDESHLNRYALDNANRIKVLDPSYGYAEGKNLPFEKRILIRDKKNYGGADFLRAGKQPTLWEKAASWIRRMR